MVEWEMRVNTNNRGNYYSGECFVCTVFVLSNTMPLSEDDHSS